MEASNDKLVARAQAIGIDVVRLRSAQVKMIFTQLRSPAQVRPQHDCEHFEAMEMPRSPQRGETDLKDARSPNRRGSTLRLWKSASLVLHQHEVPKSRAQLIT